VIATSTPGVSVGNPQGEEGVDYASVMVVGPVFQITKESEPEPVRPGRLLTYTLTVENRDRDDVITGTYYNKLEGYTPSALIPGVAETAPVETGWRDMTLAYLPTMLRGYGQ
jgi:hypothetical protein